MWTKEDLIKEGETKFKAYVDKRVKEDNLDYYQEDQLWQDFYFSCEVEAFERNKREGINMFIDLEEVKREAELEDANLLKLSHMWLSLFKTRSFCNEVPGKILFRVLLASVLKKIKFYGTNGKAIPPTMHFFFVQNSGSGKDQSIDFLREAIEAINKQYILKYTYPLIKSYDLYGTETMETLLDTFALQKNAKGKLTGCLDFTKIKKGIFSEYDLILSTECSFLFREKVFDKQQKKELFLTAMEGRPMPKKLIKWDGNETITEPNFCFIGCSRPIEKMKEYILTSGLQQRAFNYCREIDSNLRKNMLEEMAKQGFFGTDKQKREYDTKLEEFAKEFITLIDWAYNQKFEIHEMEEINKIIFTNLSKFYKDIVDNVKSKEHKIILESFIARFKNLILLLSYQNAILKKKTSVTPSDVQSAVNALTQMFNQLKLWAEENIEESKEMKFKNLHLKNHLKTLLKDGPLLRSMLIKKLATLGEYSNIYSYKLIQRSLAGENSLLIMDENKKIRLREN